MKKFLFTLATAMLAGGMFAGEFVGGGTEYFYMDDANVTENLGGTVQLNVKAHFEASVSAWQVDFGMYNENGEFISNVLPGGLTVKTAAKGSDLTLTYTDDAGDEGTTSPSLQKGQDNTRFIVASMEGNYWDPDGDGEYELQGVAKWGPGEYEQMWKMTFNIPADFTGGEIAIQTRPTSGFDNDPEVTTTAGEKAWYKFNLTVDGAQPEVTATPVISYEFNYEDEYVTISAAGDGEVKLYIDEMLVSNPFVYNFQDEEHTIVITATAQEEGKEISETAMETIVIPAKTPEPPVPSKTEKPSITYFDDPEAQTVTVTATGDGHITLYWDDMLQAEGEGTAVWVIPYGDDPEGEEFGVSAYAQEEGKEISDPALATIFVPGKIDEPYETPAPEVSANLTDDALVITATGEGTVTLYIQYIDNETGDMTTETYTGEGTVTHEVPRGEEDTFINYWATAQADADAVPGVSGTEYYVEVPAKEDTPVDPENPTIILMLIDQNGNEVPVELAKGADGDYTTTYTFEYNPWGAFVWDPALSEAENEANRPDVPFYFLINGVRYGFGEAGNMQETVLGYAMQNPLEEGAEGNYCVPVGFSYTLGVALKDGGYYVYAAVSKMTGVDEIANGKTVAGVRYFNMAGQEMQEANGMTIVVTTYTDGTTSAVKVMK